MTTSGAGPWEHSNTEEQADLNALERALEMDGEHRRTAVAVINSQRRQPSYSDGSRYQPLQLPDAWGAPRWALADAITGGNGQPIRRQLPTGSILDCVPPGSVLSPLPKWDKKPLLRCSRCGCIATKGNTIIRNGWPWCRVCCGGQNPIPSGASPPTAQ